MSIVTRGVVFAKHQCCCGAQKRRERRPSKETCIRICIQQTKRNKNAWSLCYRHRAESHDRVCSVRQAKIHVRHRKAQIKSHTLYIISKYICTTYILYITYTLAKVVTLHVIAQNARCQIHIRQTSHSVNNAGFLAC